jgi:hypothetical protein
MILCVFFIPILRNKGLDITSKNEAELLLKIAKLFIPYFVTKYHDFYPYFVTNNNHYSQLDNYIEWANNQ